MKAELSVIIPHHKDEAHLARLLESIATQKTNFEFEVVVVSNPGSTDADLLAARYKNFKNINLEEVGVNRARNAGMHASSSSVMMFFDSDCELDDSRLLQKHRDFHLENSEVACLGGVYVHTSERPLDKAYNFIQRRWLHWGAGLTSNNYLLGGHFSCKKLAVAGYEFDEAIVYGGSETELFCRLRKADKVCQLDPSLSVVHNTKLTAEDFVLKLFKQGVGSAYIEKKLDFKFQDFYSNYGAVDFSERNFQADMRFGVFLAEQAFLEGKRATRNSFPLWKRRVFIFSNWIKFKRMRAIEFLRSVEELSK